MMSVLDVNRRRYEGSEDKSSLMCHETELGKAGLVVHWNEFFRHRDLLYAHQNSNSSILK